MQGDSNFIISNLLAKAENSLSTSLPYIEDETELYFYNYCTVRKLIRAFSDEKFKPYAFSLSNLARIFYKGLQRG